MREDRVKLSETSFILQDHKRLPARFFARLSGARTSRIGNPLTTNITFRDEPR